MTDQSLLKTRLENLVALARLLERAERGALRLSADEYRRLVAQAHEALAAELPDAARDAVLDAFPSAAELYENLHYAQSGLSRSSLERSAEGELAARELIDRVRRGPR